MKKNPSYWCNYQDYYDLLLFLLELIYTDSGQIGIRYSGIKTGDVAVFRIIPKL